MASPLPPEDDTPFAQGMALLSPEEQQMVMSGLDAARNFDLGAYQAQYQKAQAAQDAALKAAQATGLSDQYTQLYGGADIIPGMTQQIFSNLGIENPYLPVYTLRGSANKGELSANERMSFAPLPGMEYRLVDKNTGQTMTASTPEEIKALAEAANALGKSGGPMANYAIESGQGGKFSTMYEDRPDISKFDRLAGMALPIAVSFIPGLQGVGAVLANAAAGAAGAAIAGGDPLKGGIMGGLTAAGTQFLGPVVESTKNALGQTVATNLGRAVGAGAGATVGGIATGQPIEKALMGGALAGGTTYLGGELFGGNQPQSSSDVKFNNPGDLAYGTTRAANAANNLNIISQNAAAQLASAGLPTASFSVFSPPAATTAVTSIPTGAPKITVTGTPVSTGAAPSFTVAPSTGMAKPEIIATAQKQAPVAEEPSFAVNVPTPTEAVGGPDLEEDIEIMARDEGLAQAEEPSFAVLPPATTTGPDTLVTGQREVPQVEQEPSFAALPPATTTGPDTLVTGQRETPLVEEKPTFAVMPPATTTGPDTLVTGQRETPVVEEKPDFAVLPPATTTGPDTLVTGQRETPLTEEKAAPVVLPPATTTGPDTLVTGKREDVKLDDKEGVGGPYIPPPEEIFVTGDKKPVVKDTNELSVPIDLGNTLKFITQPEVTDDIVVNAKKQDEVPYVDPLTPRIDVTETLSDVTKPEVKKDSTLDEVAKYMRLLGLGIGLVGNIGGGGGGSGSPGKYSSTKNLGSVFSAKLPTPGEGGAFTVGGLGGGAGGTAADRTLAARPVTDWYRYGMGPAMDIPAGADLSRATSPYAGYGPGTLGEETFKAVSGMAHGGSMGYSRGSSRESFAVQGPGTGRSDDIPAVLSDGEYVIDAETVALLGDGSSKAGAKKLDEMRVKVRKHKGKNLAKGKFSVNARRPEAYMSGGRI